MTRNAGVAVSILIVGFAAAASAQELSPAAFNPVFARIAALRSEAPTAPFAPGGSVSISYDQMARSFDAATGASSPETLLGAWLQVAEADSAGAPGRYDPDGLLDSWYRRQGVGFTLIPAKPPLQPENAYELSWGYFDKDGRNYGADVSVPVLFRGNEAYVHIPGHEEEDPVTCVNCEGGPSTHWVEDHVYAFRAAGDKKDYLVEKVTIGGSFDAATGAVSGGRSVYVGFKAAAR